MKNSFTKEKIGLVVLLLGLLNSPTYTSAQVCQTPDISQTDYEAIPWYGDENEYTALDRMYDSLMSIYDPSEFSFNLTI